MEQKIMKNKYKLIVLCGKSGAGKDYLLREVYKRNKDRTNLLVSDTTRPQREYEVDGVDYNFLFEDEFKEKEHIEESCFNNWFYGTPLNSLDAEKVNICVLNLSGVRQLYDRDDLEIKLFYITAPDKVRILRQLNREEYPNVSEICRRFLTDEEDFKNLYKYSARLLKNANKYDPKDCIEIIEDTITELLADSSKMD